jgi:glycolate oxidase FAD binding subunit
MDAALTPGSEGRLAAVVADAARARTPLAIEGGGTRAHLGRPMQTATTVSTAGLTGITLYEPAELVLSARAGTPLKEVEALLASKGQRLAFEPIDHRFVSGAEGEPTIGAVAAANLSGPRRIQVGAARDSLIGLRAVNGVGEVVKSGGRVMKNVTGYDLVKFLAGSYGTLAVLSEVTFKVLPVPETEATLMLSGLADADAVRALSTALASPHAVSGAAHSPALGVRAAETLIRIEGFADSVASRAKRLAAALAPFGVAEVLDATDSARAWRMIRDLASLGAPVDVPVWRVSVRPSDGPAVADAVRQAFACHILYDWGGGLVWIAGGEGPDGGAAAIRAALPARGGHATLIRAPEAIRNTVDVFQPLSEPVMALTQKLKAAFDPIGILNPGRMYAGV